MKGKTRTLIRIARRCRNDAKLVKDGGTRGLKPATRKAAAENAKQVMGELARRASGLRDYTALRYFGYDRGVHRYQFGMSPKQSEL